MNIDGMVAVVTGGASGLGEATARMLAAAGAKVTLFDMNGDLAASVAADIGGASVVVDVSDIDSVEAGFVTARAAHGQERILINCAGIAVAEKTVGREGPHDARRFAKVIQVNLIGTFNCASRAAAGMGKTDPVTKDGERGVIISTASVAAFEGQVGQVAYAASKAGVAGMTIPMARDLARDGIRVLTIAPGLFMTPMLKGLPEEAQQSLGAQIPFPSRLGDPVEYAHLARAMIENPMLNGEVVRLDGAIRMAPR